MKKNIVLIFICFLVLSAFILPQSWEKAYQPEGARISSIDVHPLDPDKILISCYDTYWDQFVYYTSDGADSWRLLCTTNVQTFPRFDRTSDYIYIADYGTIFRTSDLGVSWDTVYSSLYNIHDFTQNPVNNKWFMTDDLSIYRSDDGNMWEKIYEGDIGRYIEFSPIDSNKILVNDAWYIPYSLLSTDGGNTWDTLYLPEYSNPVFFDPNDDSTFYAFQDETGSYIKYLLRSTDLGVSWTILNPCPDYLWRLVDCDGENNQVIFHALGYKGIYKTTDMGLTWLSLETEMKCSISLYYNGILYAGFNARGFGINQNNSWEFRNSGLQHFQLRTICITDSFAFYSTTDNLFRTELPLGEYEWISLRPDSSFSDMEFYDNSIGFALSYQKIYKTTNSGLSWFLFHSFSSAGNWVETTDIRIIGSDIYFANEEGIRRSSIDAPGFTMLFSGRNYNVMYDGSVLYAFKYEERTLYKSANLGSSWNYVAQLDNLYDYPGFAVKDNPQGIFIGGIASNSPPSSGGILYFVKPGNQVLPVFSMGVNNIAAPKGKEEFFIMKNSQSKIYKADSLGGEFYPYETGLPVVPYGQGGARLFNPGSPEYNKILFTDRGGIMAFDLDYTLNAETIILPEKIELKQNYPNPFNPTTTISYSIPTGMNKVKLSIYDILGNEIAVLVNEEKFTGEYQVEWDASAYSSGVYFYRLQAGEFTSTKKLLLMK